MVELAQAWQQLLSHAGWASEEENKDSESKETDSALPRNVDEDITKLLETTENTGLHPLERDMMLWVACQRSIEVCGLVDRFSPYQLLTLELSLSSVTTCDLLACLRVPVSRLLDINE